jgi:hypothetical protein
MPHIGSDYLRNFPAQPELAKVRSMDQPSDVLSWTLVWEPEADSRRLAAAILRAEILLVARDSGV